LRQRRGPLISLVASFSYRSNLRVDRQAYADFKRARGSRYELGAGTRDERRAAGETGAAALPRPGRIAVS
jgi:hypothetical protein